MNRMTSVLVIAGVFLAISAQTVLAANWTITDLGTVGGTESFAYSINDHGGIVGLSRPLGDTGTHAFFWDKGKISDLYPFNSEDVITVGPSAINKSGQIASGLMVGGVYTPAIYDSKKGIIIPLGTLGGVSAYGFNGVATSINKFGQAVGYSFINELNTHAFIYRNGVLTDLGSFGGYSAAMDVNDFGVAVGFSSDVYNGYAHAALWRDGSIIDISPFGSDESYAEAINNSGQVVGSFYNGSVFRPFLHADGNFTDLGSLGGPDGSAYSINERGQIVGVSLVQVGTETGQYWDDILERWVTYTTPIYQEHGFLYDNGVMIDLNSLIPADSGWELLWAYDINNRGQIVGTGFLGSKYRAFLLTPNKHH